MRNLAAAAVLLSLSGCVVDHGLRTGSATVRWSVESVFDPRACDVHTATTSIVEVYFENGALATRVVTACDAFQATIVLDEGYYSARVTLADPSQRPVSTSVDIPPFFVARGSDTPVDIDFPVDSFFDTAFNAKKKE